MNIWILVISILLSDGDVVQGTIQYGNEKECRQTEQYVYENRFKGWTIITPCEEQEDG